MIISRVFIILISLSISQFSLAQAVEGKLLDKWSIDTIIGSTLYNNAYNEVWGLTNEGREYAVIGSTYGTHFIDVTEPENIVEVATVKGRETSGILVHRDFHDYAGYLYAVAQEGNSSLQIIDYSFLPDSVSVLYDSNSILKDAHNIFIDTTSAILYAGFTSGETAFRVPMRLFDLSDPLNPEIIKAYANIGGFSFGQMHDAYVVNDTAFINCGPGGLLIADFSDPLNPVRLGSLSPFEYPQSGYNHSGWLTDDKKTYVMADENWGADLKLFDISQLPDITLIDTIDAGSQSDLSIPHNQIIAGDYLYCAYYYDGLQVWDISDPHSADKILYYETSELDYARTYEGAWGVYPFLPSGNILVSDMQNGLFVIQGIDQSVSIENQASIEKSWEINPNPVLGSFKIETEFDLNKYKIELYDSDARLVQKFDSATEYNLKVDSGVYFLRIYNSDFSSVKRLVVAH